MRHEADAEPGVLPFVIGLGLGVAAANGDQRARAFIDEAVQLGKLRRRPKAAELEPKTLRRKRAIIAAWMAVVREARGPHKKEADVWLKNWTGPVDPSVLVWLWPFIKGAAGWNEGASKAMLNAMSVSVAQRPGTVGIKVTRQLLGENATDRDAMRLAEVQLDPGARESVRYLRHTAKRLREADEYADEGVIRPQRSRTDRTKRRWSAAKRAGKLDTNLSEVQIIETMAMRRRHQVVGVYSKPQAAAALGMSLGGVQYWCAQLGITGKITKDDLDKLRANQDKKRAIKRAAKADADAYEQTLNQLGGLGYEKVGERKPVQ